jgi:hypothetical protein
MKNTFLSFFMICLACVGAGFAQVSKPIVVEHFTNTRCSVCAGQNPSFNQNLNANPNVIRISYHPTAPYANCLLAAHNPSENDARTNFYNLYGSTPRLAINGTPISNNPNPYQNPNLYVPYQGQTSGISMRLYQQKDADSIRIRVVVSSEGMSTMQELRLYAAVAEDTIFYTSPNGENRHYNVFRKSFFGGNGLTFFQPSGSDSLVWEGKLAKHQAWNFNRIFAYAMVQNVSNRQLQQAAFSKPEDQTLTSNSEILDARGIEIYPNPTQDWVNIRIAEKGKLKADLFDFQGKKLNGFEADGEPELGFYLKKPGQYLLRLELNGKSVSKKVVRE